jgi:hypothetical protein
VIDPASAPRKDGAASGTNRATGLKIAVIALPRKQSCGEGKHSAT